MRHIKEDFSQSNFIYFGRRDTVKSRLVKDLLYQMTMERYKPKSLKDIVTKYIIDNRIEYKKENIPIELKEYIMKMNS